MNQKRNISLISVITLMIGASALWFYSETRAQSSVQGAPIDAFTFFIPYPTETLDDQFDIGFAGGNLIGEDIETIISIALHRDNSILYYDQWEDGLETNLTVPVQSSTEIWGDNDPTNGIPPGFAADILNAGDVIVLRNVVGLDNAGNRDPSVIFFDGGDALSSVGGAIAVTLAVWPQGPSSLFAGAWELYPTNRWGTDYLIPIGANLASERPGFTVVGLNVQAVQNSTTVELDLDADGNFENTVVLNQGEQFTQINSVSVGARIQASAPVQVHVLTANPASEYEARAYTIVPFNQWTDDLLAPRSSDGDFWLYNPDPTNALVISAQTITTTTALTIPANSTVKYPPIGLSGPTGVRFTSTDGRSLFGVAALDEIDAQDWGYALQPVNRLTTQTLIGLGPGNINLPPDGDQSRVYVTAINATTVFVDYENDGNPDAQFPVGPLAEIPITDPDNNLTGAFLFTNDGTPFLAVWGQDENADPALPSIDVGTSIVPLPSLLVQKTFTLADDADCTGSTSLGDTIRFRLQHFNNSVNTIPNVIIEDDLPTALTYVSNSTELNGMSIPDNAGSNLTQFPLDEGGYNVGAIDRLDAGSLSFDVIITDDTGPIINRATATTDGLELGSDFVIVFTPSQAAAPILQVDQTLIDPSSGIATIGDVITFSLTITNVSNVTITRLPLQILFNEDHLTFIEANLPPDMTDPGTIGWNDLIATFGELAPNAVINLTLSFVVDPVSDTVPNTVVEATVLEAERSDGLPPLICHDRTEVIISENLNIPDTPTPTPTPTATPTSENGDKPTSTPVLVTSTATPPATVVAGLIIPEATPHELPVEFLPETGTKEFTPTRMVTINQILVLATIGGVCLTGLLIWRRHKSKTTPQSKRWKW